MCRPNTRQEKERRQVLFNTVNRVVTQQHNQMNFRLTAKECIAITVIFLTEIISRKKDCRGRFSILDEIRS